MAAVSWLNESRGAEFYLVKVEAVAIGDSEPAPMLTLIVGPSEETRDAGETKRDLAERHLTRRRFWSQLLEMARPRPACIRRSRQALRTGSVRAPAYPAWDSTT